MSELRDQLETSLSGYRIERELGGGGMSRVFLALDARLGRQVVVKVLRPDLVAGIALRRFEREIRLSARLQHPHLVPLHSAGDIDGLPYYTMPYVEGETLRALLDREGAIPVADVTRLVREIADALAYAHAQGVVHRDLKPENVLISAGHAMIADFGVAKALAVATQAESETGAPGVSRATMAGAAVGTPAYMAPEQGVGDPTIDHRADLYALGVITYELLAGAPPFRGETVQDLVVAHVTEIPRPIAQIRPDVPPALSNLVARLLAKRPSERPQTAAEAIRILDDVVPHRRWRGFAGAGLAAALVLTVAVAARVRMAGSPSDASAFDEERVIVTSFENRSGDTTLAAFGAEAADLVALGVSQIPGVDMVPRSQARDIEQATWHRAPHEAVPVARAAKAGIVIVGDYARTSGDTLTIRVTLLDGRTGRLLGEVSPVATPLATRAAALERVRERVRGGIAMLRDPGLGRAVLVGREPPTYSAYREFAAAEDVLGSGQNDLQSEIQHLKRAAELDTSFLLPRVAAAEAHRGMAEQTGGSTRASDSLATAVEAVRDRFTPYEAARYDASRAWGRGDISGLIDVLRRAVALDSATPLGITLAATLVGVNRPREAITVMRAQEATLSRRVARQPKTKGYWNTMTTAYHLLGDYAGELAVARTARRQRPLGLIELGYEAMALAALDSTAAVQRRIDEAMTLPADPQAYAPVGGCDCRMVGDLMATVASELDGHGHTMEARRLWERALAWYRSPHPTSGSVDQRWREATVLAALDRWNEAEPLIASFRNAPADSVDPVDLLGLEGRLAAKNGDTAAAHRVEQEASRRARTARGAHVQALALYAQGQIASQLGHADEAIGLLRIALQQMAMATLWRLVHQDPALRPLRGHAAFASLVRPAG